jgi:hypothetical protein
MGELIIYFDDCSLYMLIGVGTGRGLGLGMLSRLRIFSTPPFSDSRYLT